MAHRNRSFGTIRYYAIDQARISRQVSNEGWRDVAWVTYSPKPARHHAFYHWPTIFNRPI